MATHLQSSTKMALHAPVLLALRDLEVPWHLITIAMFFALVKLPGPNYPYWGRIFIPHFTNGGLFRTLWSPFLWFRRPRKTSTLRKRNEKA